jgi:hypothetical protein
LSKLWKAIRAKGRRESETPLALLCESYKILFSKHFPLTTVKDASVLRNRGRKGPDGLLLKLLTSSTTFSFEPHRCVAKINFYLLDASVQLSIQIFAQEL